jgi:hypothetical protein
MFFSKNYVFISSKNITKNILWQIVISYIIEKLQPVKNIQVKKRQQHEQRNDDNQQPNTQQPATIPPKANPRSLSLHPLTHVLKYPQVE